MENTIHTGYNAERTAVTKLPSLTDLLDRHYGADNAPLQHSKNHSESVTDTLINLRTIQADILARLGEQDPAREQTIDTSTGASESQMGATTLQLRGVMASFPEFIARYINGRQDHLARQYMAQIRTSLQPYFAEPSDLHQVSNKVVDIVKTELKMDLAEARMLSKDIEKPLEAVVQALIEVLDRN